MKVGSLYYSTLMLTMRQMLSTPQTVHEYLWNMNGLFHTQTSAYANICLNNMKSNIKSTDIAGLGVNRTDSLKSSLSSWQRIPGARVWHVLVSARILAEDWKTQA
jgi:hypothetical protein